MLHRLGLVFAAFALFALAGGQWAVLQSVAWAGMLRDYTHQTGSFVTAVEQTFDGEHPCELCRQIAFAKAKETKEKPATSGATDDAKLKATVTETAFVPSAPSATLVVRPLVASLFGPSRAEQPLTPPPRCGSTAA